MMSIHYDYCRSFICFLITILRFSDSCYRAPDSDFERLGFSCIIFKFSISLVKLSIHFRRRGGPYFSGGLQLDVFTFIRYFKIPLSYWNA